MLLGLLPGSNLFESKTTFQNKNCSAIQDKFLFYRANLDSNIISILAITGRHIRKLVESQRWAYE